MPSNFDEKNAIVFWGQYPGNFETKFFPLRFEGILYNSQSYIYQVLQTIQMKLILLCVWAEPAVLGSTKTALKFKYKI